MREARAVCVERERNARDASGMRRECGVPCLLVNSSYILTSFVFFRNRLNCFISRKFNNTTPKDTRTPWP